MKASTDKLKHFIVCLAVALVASLIEGASGASAWQSVIAGFIAGSAIGVGKEYGDKCAPGNKWDWGDIGADFSGAVIGAVLGSLFSLLNH